MKRNNSIIWTEENLQKHFDKKNKIIKTANQNPDFLTSKAQTFKNNKNKVVKIGRANLADVLSKNSVISKNMDKSLKTKSLSEIISKSNKNNLSSNSLTKFDLNNLNLLKSNLSSTNLNTKNVKAKKRSGVSVKPILQSLASTTTKIDIDFKSKKIKIIFDGARVLTVNELFAILQYRKWDTFSYKKKWKLLASTALKQIRLIEKQQKMPQIFFDSPIKVTLYRRGKKLIDLDSLPVVFKYLVDGFKKNKSYAGLIAEDNPNIISDLECVQEIGEPKIGIIFEPTHKIKLKNKQAFIKLFNF